MDRSTLFDEIIPQTAELALPNANLYLEGGVLYKKTAGNQITGRHNLDTIEKLTVGHGTSYISVAISAFIAALIVGAIQYLESASWKLIATLPLATMLIFSIFIIRTNHVHIHLKNGEELKYDSADPLDDIHGFCSSINASLQPPR